jgi:hypothetical protein
MNAVSTKVVLQFFPPVCPFICPVYFHLVMHTHVLSPCYARYERIRGGRKGFVTYYYLACYVRIQVQNMPY